MHAAEISARRQQPAIIFMGTPEFAVSSLDALVKAGYNIVAVITAPDKPSGRGMKINISAVKKYALEHKLNILQPEKLKESQFISQLKELKADLQIVVAFRMLPEVVWSMPPMGTINVHASLLPKYRGAAPINWAIINGEKESGVTTFRLKHEVDTGNILLQQKVAIDEKDNAGDLHEKLKIAGADLLLKTVGGLIERNLQEQPQDNFSDSEIIRLTHAPKIFTETTMIDWNRPAKNIHNLVRGLSPSPAAVTNIDGRSLKIYRSEYIEVKPSSVPGQYETDHKTWLRFAAFDGYVYAKEVQAEGRKRWVLKSI